MTSLFSRPLTAHDLLKAFAVIIMIIDHIGAYFFPEQLWWRAIGRIGFPIWFYLIGHASGRDIPWKLWAGALLLIALNPVVGMSFLSLNALVTIMVLRLIIDDVMNVAREKPAIIWPMLALMAVFIFPTNMLMEYGTQALMFAMLGYMVRHKAELPFSADTLRLYMMAVASIFLVFQWADFGFSMAQFLIMAAGTMAVCLVLLDFKAAEYPALGQKMPAPVKWVLQICGRYTLEIYVLHLAIFKLAAVSMGLPNFAWFHFHIL